MTMLLLLSCILETLMRQAKKVMMDFKHSFLYVMGYKLHFSFYGVLVRKSLKSVLF